MTLVSSNTTLFFKIFLPTFWIIFFLSFTIGFFTLDEAYIGNYPIFLYRMGSLLFLVIGGALLYRYFMSIKRVEMDGTDFIVTNYKIHYRYTLDSVEKILMRDWWLFKSYTIVLKSAGSFGKKITFVGSRKRIGRFQKQFPGIIPEY